VFNLSRGILSEKEVLPNAPPYARECVLETCNTGKEGKEREGSVLDGREKPSCNAVIIGNALFMHNLSTISTQNSRSLTHKSSDISVCDFA